MQYEFKISAKNKECDTQYLCSVISAYLNKNDTILLWGDLGSGKTFFTSYFINHLKNKYQNPSAIDNVGNDADHLVIQSPTFNLTYEYELEHYEVQHYDFYRLNDYDEIIELGYEDNLEEKLIIIEWPERLDNNLPENRLDIKINYDENEDGRIFTLIPHGDWQQRIERLICLEHFLNSFSLNYVIRKGIFQDASLRRYERLHIDNKSYVLMDFPSLDSEFCTLPDKENLISYFKNSYRAHNVLPYIYYTNYLKDIGLKIPEIYHINMEEGFLIIEDFGDNDYSKLKLKSLAHNKAYELAIDNIIELQKAYTNKTVTLKLNENDYKPSIFADDATLIIDYYYNELSSNKIANRLSGEAREETRNFIWGLWHKVFSDNALSKTISLRDYHSPNLFWLANNNGIHKTGIIDFQDAFIAPAAYDFVSLIQDGRILYDTEFEENHLDYYFKQFSANEDYKSRFLYEYNLCACQRASKNLGLFVRLALRDNKQKYLKYLAINLAYLKRSLNHPSLELLKTAYDKLNLIDERNIDVIMKKFEYE